MNELKMTDFLDVKVQAMKSIPPDSNPFHYDRWNMGTPLTRDWVVMHEGYGMPDHPLSHHFLILCNTRSGQRMRINFVKQSLWSKLTHPLKVYVARIRSNLRVYGWRKPRDVLTSNLGE